MTRVVMRLKNDISSIMPILAREIPGCAYGPRVPIVSFRYNNWRGVVQKDEITVLDVKEESNALETIEYLKKVIKTSAKGN